MTDEQFIKQIQETFKEIGDIMTKISFTNFNLVKIKLPGDTFDLLTTFTRTTPNKDFFKVQSQSAKDYRVCTLLGTPVERDESINRIQYVIEGDIIND